MQPDPRILGWDQPELRITLTELRVLWEVLEPALRNHDRSSMAKHRQQVLRGWLQAANDLLDDRRFVDEPTTLDTSRAGARSGHDALTSDQAAELMHVVPQYVTRLCREGQLDARQVGRTWLITRESVEDYIHAYRSHD